MSSVSVSNDPPWAQNAALRVPHGGNLSAARVRFGGRADQWLDLSTGINPTPYPVPAVPADFWHRLPDDDDANGDLNQAIRHYYGHAPYLPVAGSQAAIRALPGLLAPGKVGLADLSYGEYAPAFTQAGHETIRFAFDTADVAARAAATASNSERCNNTCGNNSGNNSGNDCSIAFVLDDNTLLPAALRYLVVVNPNNPTAHRFSTRALLRWAGELQARGGLLIVDEAFADLDPGTSLLGEASWAGNTHGAGGLVVLRSIGKFFGLAGIRAGVVFGPQTLLDRLGERLGAWTVSGPARYAMQQALTDSHWQSAMRDQLQGAGQALCAMLQRHGLPARDGGLFAWAPCSDAAQRQAWLARQYIWTRLFPGSASAGDLPSLRIGLPGDQHAMDRLEQALAAYSASS